MEKIIPLARLESLKKYTLAGGTSPGTFTMDPRDKLQISISPESAVFNKDTLQYQIWPNWNCKSTVDLIRIAQLTQSSSVNSTVRIFLVRN